MIKIENTETYGWEAAIRGMRNPLNSWNKSDSKLIGCTSIVCRERECGKNCIPAIGACGLVIGDDDLKLMKKLIKSGNDHSKFMRFIAVTCDVTAPLYFFKEYDTYKVGTVANSCSTMHKIADKEFTLDDFSHEHLAIDCLYVLKVIISKLNGARNIYNNFEKIKKSDNKVTGLTKKDVWWQMIQLLPTSYNQKRTVMLNYAVLRNMYFARRNHKLDEWHDFCKWIESLPYSELITMEE